MSIEGEHHKIVWEKPDEPLGIDFVQRFAKDLGVDQVGVAFRTSSDTSHAVLYRTTPESLTWKFIDFQGFPEGKDLNEEEAKIAEKGLRVVFGFLPFNVVEKGEEILVLPKKRYVEDGPGLKYLLM